MALKDWQRSKIKTRPRSIVVYEKNDGKIIWIQKSIAYGNSFRFGGVNKRGYIKDEYFKTKSQALAHAKAYMKSH